MLGIKISIDIQAALINYYKNKRKIDTKNKGKYCDTVMVIARRVIYTLYYKEEQIIKDNFIKYELIKTIRLTLNFRKTCSIFLNNEIEI